MRLIVSTLFVVPLVAVSTAMPAAAQIDPAARLLPLAGEVATVHYEPGSLDRAAHVQDWLEGLGVTFERWRRPRRLTARVMGRRLWQRRYPEIPYGVPTMSDGELALPALGDDGTTALWRSLLGGWLPPVAGTPLRGSSQSARSLQAADLLGRCLVARELAVASGVDVDEPWLVDLIAHLLVIESEQGNGAVRLLDEFYRRLGNAQTGRTTPLENFTTGMPYESWLWFEARFFTAAAIVARSRRRPLKWIDRLAGADDDRLGADRLIAAEESLAAWMSGFPAAAPSDDS